MNNFKNFFIAATERIRNSKRTGIKKRSNKKDPTTQNLTTIRRNEKNYSADRTNKGDPSSNTYGGKG